jgi:EmrB/QacA subfamily drug resistance transporter
MSTPQPDPRRWLALAIMLSATLLAVLDFLIVNIALPSIRRELGASDAQIQLVVAGYGLAFAVCLITGGRLGDIYGRKRLFQIGMIGFTLMSMLCGFAQTPQQLVIFRMLQGLVASMMTPQVLATVQVMFAGRERDTATGMVGAVVGVGSFVGNVLGGWLIGANLFELGWRPIFFVNVPIGVVAVLLAQLWVPESKSPAAPKLDPVGALLSALGLFLVIFPLAEGREKGWPWWSFALLILAAIACRLFVRYEQKLEARGGSPLISTELLESSGFACGLLGILLLFGGISSFSLVLTLFLQEGLDVAPKTVGVIFAALSVSFLIASLSAVKIVQRLGTKTLLIGLWMMQLGQIALIALPLYFGNRLNPFALMPVLFFYGFGQGLSVPQIIRRTLNEVGTTHAGAAAGMLNTTQQVGFSLGVSVIGSVFFAVVESSAQSTLFRNTFFGASGPYAGGVAAAFACNFVLLLVTRILVARNFRHQDAREQAASAVAVMEA